jgi:hypothetical protein
MVIPHDLGCQLFIGAGRLQWPSVRVTAKPYKPMGQESQDLWPVLTIAVKSAQRLNRREGPTTSGSPGS